MTSASELVTDSQSSSLKVIDKKNPITKLVGIESANHPKRIEIRISIITINPMQPSLQILY